MTSTPGLASSVLDLMFSKPIRGGKRHNLASVIKKRADDVVQSVNNSSNSSVPPNAGPLPPLRKPNSAPSLAARICSKIEDGNVRAAVRILSSEETSAAMNQDTLQKLIDKHPAAPSNRVIINDTCSATKSQPPEVDSLRAI